MSESTVAAAEMVDARVLLDVLSRLKGGDFSARMPIDWTGLAGKAADGLNDVIIANQVFEAELGRVSRVVGKQGELSQRVVLGGWTQSWSGSVESVNSLIDALVRPTSEMQRVVGAVADGDLSKKITVDVHGEMLELKNTVNTMVDQLNGFISEVTRVVRDVGTEGKLGQAAAVTIEVGGVWKDLTDNVNLMAGNLTGQVRNIAEVTTAVANGDLSKKISADVKGEFLELKNTVNAMVDQLNRFASEVTRVAREVGIEGKLGGQAQSAEIAGVWKDLTDNVNPARGEPHQSGPRDLRRGDGSDPGRPDPTGRSRSQRRGRRTQGQAQRDDPQSPGDHAPEHRAGLVEDQPRAFHSDAARPARPRDRLEPDPG
jgi:Methyl-accepting chemotaxis protein